MGAVIPLDMLPERTVSSRPDAQRHLRSKLEHAHRIRYTGGVIDGNGCDTTFEAYDLLNASA